MDIEWKMIKNMACGTATKKEKETVRQWASESPENRRFLNDCKRYYAKEKPYERILSTRDINRVWTKINPSRYNTKWHYRPRIWMATSVAVAVILVGALLLIIPSVPNPLPTPAGTVQFILADGSVYEIESKSLQETSIPGFAVDNNGNLSQIEDNASEQEPSYIEVKVTRGTTYSITIADGTYIQLNTESSLRFPSSFNGKERMLYLDGEAYFEVVRDEEKPFVVKTGNAMISVLGTAFNVKAYHSQSSSVTLVSGSVAVSTRTEELVLKAGEQCEINKDSGILTVNEADLPAVFAWKEGEFIFKDCPLHDIIEELSRWYDFDVVYEEPQLKDERFYVFVQRSQSLTEILDKIAKTDRMTYKIVKGRVMISQ